MLQKVNAQKSTCKKKVLIMWKPMYMYVEKESISKGHAIVTDLNFNVIYIWKKNRSYEDVEEKNQCFLLHYIPVIGY